MALQYSLIIIFIHVCFQQGMILFPVARLLHKLCRYEWMRKPLYECVVCMSGIYTVGLWFIKDHEPLSLDLLWLIMIVGGINTLAGPVIEAAIFKLHKDRTA